MLTRYLCAKTTMMLGFGGIIENFLRKYDKFIGIEYLIMLLFTGFGMLLSSHIEAGAH